MRRFNRQWTHCSKKMTTEEKIGQLSQLFVFKPGETVEKSVAAGEVGSLLFITDPAVINRLQHLAVEKSRLHIPLIFGYDVIHGFRTIFPAPIAMAASWDPALEMQGQTTAAKEARAVGISWAFAPMLDIARDPRWGQWLKVRERILILVQPWLQPRFVGFRASTSERPIMCWPA